MRRICYRVILCFTAVSCFWLGALSGGQKMEIPEQTIAGICEAAKQTLDLEKAGQYLSEKLPAVLAEAKKIFPTMGNDLFFGQYL